MPDPKLQEEQRRRALEAYERRATEQRERGMPRLRREREERELAAEMAFDFKLISLSKQQRYDLLGPAQKWREHIDGRHQHWGENVYIRGHHRLHQDPHARPQDVADPEYNARMMNADRFVSSTFNFGNFDREAYARLHGLVSRDQYDFGAHPRVGELTLTFNQLHDSAQELMDEHDPFIARIDISTPGTCRIVLAAVEKPLEEVDRILREHYQAMRFVFDPDEALLAVARTHKALENLHAYVDYNTRTNRLVLNRLLVDASLTPAVLDSPLNVHHMTLPHWVEHIREGQKVWQKLVTETGNLDAPDAAWVDFNREQALRRRLGLL